MAELEKITQEEDIKVVKLSAWARIRHWWRTLWREEWELTIFFSSAVKFMEDGSRIESTSPKTYRAKALKKLSTTHIIFVDLLGVTHEIKVVNPVGYDVRKIY